MAPPKKPSCLRIQPCVVRLLNMPRQCGTLSSSIKFIYDIEMVQHRAVRFICDLKGRVSISAAFAWAWASLSLICLSWTTWVNVVIKVDTISFLQFCLMKSVMRYFYTRMTSLWTHNRLIWLKLEPFLAVNLKQFMQNRQPIATAFCPILYGKWRLNYINKTSISMLA